MRYGEEMRHYTFQLAEIVDTLFSQAVLLLYVACGFNETFMNLIKFYMCMCLSLMRTLRDLGSTNQVFGNLKLEVSYSGGDWAAQEF